jgi:glycosyltransferase involved in cell wall biosynthesis
MSTAVVSVIMAAFNVESYLYQSIESLIKQSHHDWELIIVNDGSTDKTSDIAKSFNDSRIKYCEQDNQGVSSARNLGLALMTGDYFCFLDGDDAMPQDSIKARLDVFQQHPDISFVDGVVIYMNENMIPTRKQYVPSFKGYPYNELLRLSRSCYFGNTWLIKKEAGFDYRFSEEMTHAEDLLFFLTISKDRKYTYTESPVLYYRERKNSAMKDLTGLEQGYINLLKKVRQELHSDPVTLKVLKKRIIRIMFLSHLFDGRDPFSAVKSIFRFLITV